MNSLPKGRQKEQANMKSDWPSLILLVALAVASRFLPHPPNFTGVGAVALLSGFLFRRVDLRFALLIPVAAMLISDLFLGFHSLMFFVYGGMLLMTGVGILFRKWTAKWLAAGTILASTLFFAISNLGVWLVGGYYSATWAGLIECYAMALPFFKNQLAGDLVWTAGLLGVYAVARRLAVEPRFEPRQLS